MNSIFSTFPALYRAAPRLTTQLFTCSCRFRQSPSSTHYPISQKALRSFQSVRYTTTRRGPNPDGLAERPSPLSSLSRIISKAEVLPSEARTSNKTLREHFFPEVSHKAVAYWLLGSAASVFGIVVFGGLTRLTESGYSLSYIQCIRLTDFHQA